jgi:hypothetical protein
MPVYAGTRVVDCWFGYAALLPQVPDGPDGQTAELRAGDMMVIKYTTVAQLVQSGQVTLL